MRFHLGDTPQGRVTIGDDDLETHMQVIGSTGGGKSFFLRYLAEQLITAPHEPCLIVLDPHGSLYRQLKDLCVYLGIKERVVLFDPSSSPYIIGYNPMKRDARDLSYQAMMMLEACRKVWGQETFNQTPRLARWLYNAFYGAIEAGLTFEEVRYILDPLNHLYRAVIASETSNGMVRADWEWMLAQKNQQLIEERLESSLNRIRLFLDNSRIANILTQQQTVLRLREIMDGGKILLVNLESHGQQVSPEHIHLLGTLLVNDVLAAAFARAEGERRPVYLMIDEFHNFVTKDLCAILDGGRKFGLHLILAHQHAIGQIKERDPEVYYSVLTNARTKVIFGGLSCDDAEQFAKQTFRLDPNKVKLRLYRTYFEPQESTREVLSYSQGYVTNTALSSGFTSGTIYGPDGGFFDPGVLRTSEARVTGTASSSGEVSGEATAVVPFYEYHQREELASVQFESLEEQLYQAVVHLIDQPTQYAAVKIPNRQIKFVKVPTLKQVFVTDGRRREFEDYIFTTTGYYSKLEAIEKERRLRESKIKDKFEAAHVT
ncbi:MAG: type IV secretion system DNA-binding domain-containing protein [Candidatus Hadarchaeum sp.]